MDIKRLVPKRDPQPDPLAAIAAASTMQSFMKHLQENKIDAKITLAKKSSQMCIAYEVKGKFYYYNISDGPFFDPKKSDAIIKLK